MVRRRLALAAALVVGLLLPATPAHAATVSYLASKGQLTFSVGAASSPFVRIQLDALVESAWGGDEARRYATSPAVPTTGGSAEVTIPAWGLARGVATVLQCSGESPSACQWSGIEIQVQGVDPGPGMTWDDLSTITTDGPSYDVSVEETDGGGVLFARFGDAWEQLPAQGAATLSFAEELNRSGAITVTRCQDATGTICAATETPASPPLAIRRGLPLNLQAVQTENGMAYFNPSLSPEPDVTAWLVTSEPGDYLVDVWVEPTGSEEPVPGVGQDDLAVSFPDNGSLYSQLQLPLDLSGLAEGEYDLNVTISREYDGVGQLVSQVREGQESDKLRVDTTPPAAAVTTSRSMFYPVADGYLDSVSIMSGSDYMDVRKIRYEVLADATVVRSVTTSDFTGAWTWTGRDQQGALVPEGVYTFRVTVWDAVGNPATVTGGKVTVQHERLVQRTFKKTVTAAGSRFATDVSHIGRCSTLRQPSLRGWAGSLGLYTNTKCQGDLWQSAVIVTHRVAVPAAFRYGDLRITTYGGAAKARPGSYLYFDQMRRTREWADDDRRLSYTLGAHPGPLKPATGFVLPDRTIVWGVYTALGARYDVRDFTITLKYTVLV